MDAEIRTHQALHEAKPSECPKGDRDNKSEVYFKNRLFLQPETPLKRAGSALCWFYLSFLSIDTPIATVAIIEII